MSRRAQRPELEFGSDSFLDVVCNIVGILIILIVVVGVKVDRQPKVGISDVTSEAQAQRVHQASEMARRQQTLAKLQESEVQLSEKLQSLQADSERAQQQIRKTMEEQELERQQLAVQREKSSRMQKQVTDLESDRAALGARVVSLQKAIDEKGEKARQVGQVLATAIIAEQDLDEELRTTVIETQRLKEVLEETTQAAVPRDVMQHRLSPVTKPVEKDELHFRISNGRISQVPLDQLLERLKAQVRSRSTTVMRFNQFEGTVGPVNGYTMTYTVEKEGPSTLEALQSGDGRTRVNVSRWTIEPVESLVDETFDEAIRPGSRYRQGIETAVPDTVVTMWIYPDSFIGFAALREVAHGLQLRVAARPLPAGTPIVGSPSGSKSTAQ